MHKSGLLCTAVISVYNSIDMLLPQFILVRCLDITRVACLIRFAGINEQDIRGRTVLFEHKDARRDGCTIEQVLRETDHSIQQIFFYHPLADSALCRATEQYAMRCDRRDPAVYGQAGDHVEQECPVALTCRRHAPVKPMKFVQGCLHLELFFTLSRGFAAGVEAGCPFVLRERHIGNDGIEQQQISVCIQKHRISKGVAPADLRIPNFVDVHIHLCHGD